MESNQLIELYASFKCKENCKEDCKKEIFFNDNIDMINSIIEYIYSFGKINIEKDKKVKYIKFILKNGEHFINYLTIGDNLVNTIISFSDVLFDEEHFDFEELDFISQLFYQAEVCFPENNEIFNKIKKCNSLFLYFLNNDLFKPENENQIRFNLKKCCV